MVTETRTLKIALGQIHVVMGDKEANTAALFGAIAAAAEQHCDLVVLPECSLVGWLSPAARTHAEPFPGPVTERLCELALRHHIAIVAGLEELDGASVFNAAVFIDTAGKIVLRHRKINELAEGLALYSRGHSLQTIEVDGVSIGLVICADSWTPHLVDSLYLMGAQIIASPCAWAIERGGEAANRTWISEIYRSLTHDKQLYLLAANGVGSVTDGPWAGKILQGDSMVFGPGGQKLLQGPTNEPGVLVCEIEISARAGSLA